MKFSGKIGFVQSEQVRPKIFKPVAVEKHYKGDIIKKSAKWQQAEKSTDDIMLSMQVSVVANPYAYEHLHEIRYIVWHDAAWKVVNIDVVNRPRVILEIGGVYNGRRPDDDES